MNIILSKPKLTNKQRAKCVNVLAGVLTKRKITRDRSVLEVAAVVTGSASPSRSSRVARQVSFLHLSWNTGLTPFNLATYRTECSPRAGHRTTYPGQYPTAKVRHQAASQGMFNVFLSAQPLEELSSDAPDEFTEEPRVANALLAAKQGPSRQPLVPRIITRHGTEVFRGLITPRTSPIKTPGNSVCFYIAHSSHLTHLHTFIVDLYRYRPRRRDG